MGAPLLAPDFGGEADFADRGPAQSNLR
jgi:hypothetical protein